MNFEKMREILCEIQYPLEYNPEEWNEFRKANCYTYALGLKVDEPFLIGDIIGKRVSKKDSISSQLEVFFEEMDALGFYTEECEPTDIIDEDDTFKIFIEWDLNNEYHFIRQDENGIWSHKAKGLLPTNLDKYGNLILNPEYSSGGAFFSKCFLVGRF